MKPTYEARAQIFVKMGRESLFIPANNNPSPIISINSREQINSEIEIIRSRSLAQMALVALSPKTLYQDLDNRKGISLIEKLFANLGTRPNGDPKQENLESAIILFQKSLKVEGVRGSNLINVGFRHENPQIAATVVNRLAAIYLDHHLKIHKTPQSYEFFKQQSELLKKRIKLAEEKLNLIKKQYKISSIEEQRGLLLRQTSELRVNLNRTQSQEAETENRIVELRRQLAVSPKTIAQESEVDHNPYLISNLQARLVELELEQRKLLAKYNDKSLMVKNVTDAINIVRNKLVEYEDKKYGRTRSGLNPTFQRLQDELLRNEAEIKALQAKRKILQDQLRKYRLEFGELNQIEGEYSRLEDELEVDRKNYQLYLSKFEESRISDAMDDEKITNVSLVEPAHPPLKPVSPKKRLNILISLFVGIFGGLGSALLLEYFNDRLERPEEVEETLNVAVLTSIPDLKDLKKLEM
jgi:uncharacterized protein involved in exopolysaccharide biosynthesis